MWLRDVLRKVGIGGGGGGGDSVEGKIELLV